jgi:hypothetical protein
MMKWLHVFVVTAAAMAVGLAVTLFAATASAQTPTPGQVDLVARGQQWLDALNAGNLDAAMAFMTDDAVWEGTGGCLAAPCVGTAAVRAEFATFAPDHVHVTVISSQVSGNTVTGKVEAASDTIRAAGVERIVLSYTVEWRGDKIASNRLALDTSDAQTATFLASLAAVPSTGTGGSISGGSVTGWVLAAGALLAVGLLATTGGGLAFARRRRS